MKFMLLQASKDDYVGEIEINSIEELKKIQEKFNCNLLVNFFSFNYETGEKTATIMICDDYIE